MRKIALLVLSLLLLSVTVFPFVGCTSGQLELVEVNIDDILARYPASDYTYDGESVTLSMVHWSAAGADLERKTTEAVLEGFQKRYPTIKVEMEILDDYENQYANRFAAGNVHDVFVVPDGVFNLWVSGSDCPMMSLDNLLQYSTLLSEENRSQIISTALNRYKYNPSTRLIGDTPGAQQFCLPKDIGPQVMYYNKDIFDEAGVAYPPSDRIMSITEATEMWKALKKVDRNGNVSRYAIGALPTEGLVWSAGGDFLNESRTAFPTDEATIAGLKKAYGFMQKAIVEDQITPAPDFMPGMDDSALFSAQKVATIITGRWYVAQFRTLPFNWDVAYVPAFDEEHDGVVGAVQTANSWSGSASYAIYKNIPAEKTLAAFKLVEYFASKEGQEILAATGAAVPFYEDLAMDPVLVEREKNLGPQNYEIFVQSAKNQRPGLWSYRSNQQWKRDGFDNLSGNMFNSNVDLRWSVDKFIEEAEKAVNSLL